MCQNSRESCLPLSPIAPLLAPLVSHLLDGASAFQRALSPLISFCLQLRFFWFPFVEWCFLLSWVLSSLVPLLVFLGWMMCPPSLASCLPVSPIAPLLASLCWMVCPRLASPGLPYCAPFFFPVVGLRARFPKVARVLFSFSPMGPLCL